MDKKIINNKNNNNNNNSPAIYYDWSDLASVIYNWLKRDKNITLFMI